MKLAVRDSTGVVRPRAPGFRSFTATTLILGFSAALLMWRAIRHAEVRPPGADSPYRTVAANVRYVGDEACTRCHGEIAESYRRHPMGRSLAPIEDPSWIRTAGGVASARFVAQGLEYSSERDGDRVVHRETSRDTDGRVIAQISAEVRYVLGSGKQALGFLIERDGFLFESPITFYVGERRWGLSPGYEKHNRHFNRPVLADCLFCHTNRVEAVEGPANRYRAPIFRGHAIGCERCHGPGELHVKRTSIVDGGDLTIVNPAQLEPSLRDGVCEQCHLIGRRRVVRAGRKSEDYRPGLPYQRFWAAFVEPRGAADGRFAGQVEQMHGSQCYRASGGRLGCTSCHDPHDRPAREAAAEYYRGRCLECHADHGCSLPEERRRVRNACDDCTACHMPRLGTSNNAHLATTDHRILRDARSGGRGSSDGGASTRGLESFVNFHGPLLDARDRQEAERDRGVAFCRDGRAGATMALPLLEAALARHPDDAIAWESKAAALRLLNRHKEAFEAYKEALSRAPNRESTIEGAAEAAAQSGRYSEAVALWRKATAINPWRPRHHAELARSAARLGEWRIVADSAQEAVRLQPFDLESRGRLVQGLVRGGDVPAGRAELHTMTRLRPDARDMLLRWYDSQLSRR